MERTYLDYQNGTPLHPDVLKAVDLVLRDASNPSSLHAEGRRAAQALEKARAEVAALIRCSSSEVIFTSGGTESNAAALTGLARAASSKGKHLVLSSVEHLSLLYEARRLEKEGFSVTLVPVDRFGSVDPAEVDRAIRPDTVLVSVQWASAEVGTVQPLARICQQAKAKRVLFHTDAAAAAGQVPIDLKQVPADALSLAANVFGGPPGTGVLFLRKGTRSLPFVVGGAQEEGRRAGTENVAGIAGMGEAARIAREQAEALRERLIPLRDQLIHGILERIPGTSLNGHPSERLPGHASFSFPGRDAETLVLALDLEGVSVGLGSACSHQAMKASHVLKAMGVEESRALGTVVCSLGPDTDGRQIARALDIIPRVAAAPVSAGKKQ